MNFFEQQSKAHRRTRHLVLYFVGCMPLFLALVYLSTAPIILAFEEAIGRSGFLGGFLVTMLNHLSEIIIQPYAFLKWICRPDLFYGIAGGTLLIVALGSFYKIHQLAEGGSAVADLFGGRAVNPDTTDIDELKLRHVIEEMAIASGMPVPEIYVLDEERGINSFAAGHTTSDAAICVTRGCLKSLTRDELQGAMAHEFSHILNGDMRLNMRLMGLAHGILFPVIAGRVLVRRAGNAARIDDPDYYRDMSPLGFPLLVAGVFLQIAGWAGLPFVRLIKSAICREREWLADASAVQFTRNPDGIAGALEKTGGLIRYGRLVNPNAETASHLYFTDASFGSFFPFLATHPPLKERIVAVDPRFDGKFPHVALLPMSDTERADRYAAAVASLVAMGHGDEIPVRLSDSTSVTESVPMSHRIRDAAILRAAIPPEISRAVRAPGGAMAFVYALLLDPEPGARETQLQALQKSCGAEVYRQTLELAPGAEPLDERVRLALLDLSFAALRGLDAGQYQQFSANVNALIDSDRAITLFEYTIQKALARHLAPCFEAISTAPARFSSLQPLLPECAVVLSAVAHIGRDDPGQIAAAFRRGVENLDAPDAKLELLDFSDCNLPQIEAALERIAQAKPVPRKNLMYACAQAVAGDRHRIAGREMLLLRAIADSLDCPVPPLVEAMENV